MHINKALGRAEGSITWFLFHLMIIIGIFVMTYGIRRVMINSYVHKLRAENSNEALITIFDNLGSAVLLV